MEEKTPLAVPNEKPWTNAPNINFDRDKHKIRLDFGWSGHYDSR